jgi:phosphohistidine swiveling domain-containing protein
MHLTETPTNITGHPFHGANNINDVDIVTVDGARGVILTGNSSGDLGR